MSNMPEQIYAWAGMDGQDGSWGKYHQASDPQDGCCYVRADKINAENPSTSLFYELARIRMSLGCNEKLMTDEIADYATMVVAERDALKSRLEVSAHHSIDGIEARDTTIKGLENVIAELKAENERMRCLLDDTLADLQ